MFRGGELFRSPRTCLSISHSYKKNKIFLRRPLGPDLLDNGRLRLRVPLVHARRFPNSRLLLPRSLNQPAMTQTNPGGTCRVCQCQGWSQFDVVALNTGIGKCHPALGRESTAGQRSIRQFCVRSCEPVAITGRMLSPAFRNGMVVGKSGFAHVRILAIAQLAQVSHVTTAACDGSPIDQICERASFGGGGLNVKSGGSNSWEQYEMLTMSHRPSSGPPTNTTRAP